MKIKTIFGVLPAALLLLGTSTLMTGCLETLAVGAGLGVLGSEAYQNHKKVNTLETRMTANEAHDAQQDYDINWIGNYAASKPWITPKDPVRKIETQPDWRSIIPDGRGGL